MKRLYKKETNLKLAVVGGMMLLPLILPFRAAALDASFVPQAKATLTCQDENKTDKKLTNFTNNAPSGSKVILMEGTSTGFGKEVAVGDVVVNTPQLFWSIEGVQLGPWEVPITIEGKCLTSESAYQNDPPASQTKLLPYVIGAGVVVVLVGVFMAGKMLGRK